VPAPTKWFALCAHLPLLLNARQLALEGNSQTARRADQVHTVQYRKQLIVLMIQ
jgi:hypothetical protein